MEALPLLWMGLATLVFLAVFLGRRMTRHTPFSPMLPMIGISDAGGARRLLFDHADAFSNRPTTPFPLDFASAEGRKHYSISSMPYGPLWRMFRCSLTADVLHPTRLSLLEPLRREAVEGLVAGLSAAADAGEVVAVRGSIRAAAYTLMARACFGDGVGARDVRAIERAQMEFLVSYAGAKAAERSRLPRIVFWRRWLRFDAAFHRLSAILVPLIVARRRRMLQTEEEQERAAGNGNGGGSSSGLFVPYVDTLFNLRVHDGDDDDGAGAGGGGRVLREKEMAPLVWEFIVAAESVSSCVEWALAHLVARPEVQDKLHREVVAAGGVVADEHLRSTPYLRAVVLESLRMHPPVAFLMREGAGAHAHAAAAGGGGGGATTTKTKQRATSTPVVVIIDAGDIGRDGDAWTDPDEFRPERFLAGGEGESVASVPGPKQDIKMMPFGAGRRHCPGAGMGMLHAGCFLAALVHEFEFEPAPPAAHAHQDGGVDMTELDMFFKLMKTPLRVRITPRSRP